FRCDVTDRDEVEVLFGNVVEVWDRVDILVNNAGASGMTPIDLGDEPGVDASIEAKWREVLAANLAGGAYLTRRGARHIHPGGTGRVLNISSVLGKFGVAGYAAYCASKHGLIGFTKALALELAPRKITANALCPGWVETDMARAGIEAGARREGLDPAEFRRR